MQVAAAAAAIAVALVVAHSASPVVTKGLNLWPQKGFLKLEEFLAASAAADVAAAAAAAAAAMYAVAIVAASLVQRGVEEIHCSWPS